MSSPHKIEILRVQVFDPKLQLFVDVEKEEPFNISEKLEKEDLVEIYVPVSEAEDTSSDERVNEDYKIKEHLPSDINLTSMSEDVVNCAPFIDQTEILEGPKEEEIIQCSTPKQCVKKSEIPPKLNISNDVIETSNEMKIVYDKIQELRAENREPSRLVRPVVIGSEDATDAINKNNQRSNYEYDDGEFTIEPLLIAAVEASVKRGKTYSRCFKMVVDYKYEIINNCCILNTKSFELKYDKRGNTTGFNLYTYCSFPTCNKLRFEATYSNPEKNSMFVKVTSNKKNEGLVVHLCHENGEMSIMNEQLRGVSRIEAKATLKNSKAFPYRSRCISSLGSINLQQQTGKDVIPSGAVMRTAKSEDQIRSKRHTNPWADIIFMKQENPDFIKMVSDPLNVELSYMPACEFYKNNKEHDVVYFDASGSTCGHPNHKENAKRIRQGLTPLQENKVLFYTTVAEKNKALLPLQMLITEDHTALNIGFHQRRFKNECLSRKIWPIFRKVILDFAPALSIALNYAYNDFPPNSTALAYYQYCYEVLTAKAKVKNDFIVVQGCCSHLAKIISKDLDKNFPNMSKKTKHLIQESMAYATTTSSLKDQEKWWILFTKIFGSKNNTIFVQEAISEMHLLLQKETEKTVFTRDGNVQYPNPIRTEPSIFRNSPFFKFFKKASDTLKDLLNVEAPLENEYYVGGLVEHFLNKYMYNTCFWTNSMGCLVNSGGKTHLATAYAEVFHKVFKQDLCEGKENMDVPQFCRFVKKQVNISMYDMGGQHSRKRKFVELNDDNNNDNFTEDLEKETWQRGKPHTFYDGVELERIIQETEVFRPKNIIAIIQKNIKVPKARNSYTDFLQNGLFQNMDYYSFLYIEKLDEVLNISVGFYNYLNFGFEKLPSGFNLSLTVHDFLCLNSFEQDLNFITDGVINIYSRMLIKFYNLEHMVCILDARQSTYIFENSIKRFRNLPSKINNFVMFPFITESGHWAFCFANMEDLEFTYIDPSNQNIENSQKYFEKFKLFLKKMKISHDGWVVKNYDYSISDSQNSGFVVLILFEEIFKQLELGIKSFCFLDQNNILLLKNNMKRELIHNSESISLFCFKCGTKNPIPIGAKCNICKKVACKLCSNVVSKDICIICKCCFINI